MRLPPAPTPAQRAAMRVRPATSAVMRQAWRHLLFLHWRWDPAEIQSRLPPGLHVDTHDGAAWLGVVPFWMDAVRPSFLPPLPGLSWFLELNLRTYVYASDGTPGVWFFSLDCQQPLAVRIAQTIFSLPYVDARQAGRRPTRENPVARFSSARSGGAATELEYEAAGPAFPAQPGTLEYFLIERYAFFSRTRGGALREGRVWHPPYVVAPARVLRAEIGLLADNGFETPERPADHALVSSGVAIHAYPLRTVAPTRSQAIADAAS